MSKLIENIMKTAKSLHKTIVLPEGNDPRIAEAAKIIEREGIANAVVLTNTDDRYAELLYDLRKDKGLTLDEAKKLSRDPLYYGALMVKAGDADGMVAGAINSTGNVLRPALQVIKTAPGIKTVSSCFIMDFEGTPFKQNDVMIFADCAVNIEPDASQLADIAIASAISAKSLAGIKEPKVAMLSFSTKGSAKHENVDKVVEALKIVREKALTLAVDGELQVDAALSKTVAQIKAPKSAVAGEANVLIFPDLQSGNIGYKLVQRMSGAEAIGPVCQGFQKPVNDLSRGCSVSDVVSVVAITAIQSAKQ